MITLFGAHICPLDLITDSKTAKLSSSKMWFHAANIILSYKMLNMDGITWDILTAYAAFVGGNHIAMQWIKWKYGPQNTDAPKE